MDVVILATLNPQRHMRLYIAVLIKFNHIISKICYHHANPTLSHLECPKLNFANNYKRVSFFPGCSNSKRSL
ncbi:hypothetical protein T4B_10448 [Trichinella pseudospiralis]|uniref:Uncharacterized protein n=1 Tax=Trichinella pseudospiralis TaxID=6337 RepID=A0A0V1J304_TRIPS|nr:hypothetical protein T4B_10448 [Trichinella pseudospiralis]